MSESPQQRASLLAPMPGDVIAQADIPDPAFAGGAMGVGFGVVPEENTVVAPVSGRITMVADTGHAVGFETPDGLQVLLHLGVDTVELKGAPFRLVVAKGDTVQAGDPVGTMDLAAVEAAGKSTVAITVITNSKKRVESLDVRTGRAQAGDPVADALLKAAAPAAPAQAEAAPASSGTSAAPSGTAPEAAGATVEADDGYEGLTGFALQAARIIDGIGGADNVASVIHCITRVRFYLKDDAKADDAAVADIDGVIDVAKAGGQYQVVIGATVGDVYEEIVKRLPQGTAGDDEAAAEPVEKPTTPLGWVKYGFSSLIGVITGSMIPVVGVLAGSGILKGLLGLLVQAGWLVKDSDTNIILNAMADSMFFFLPIIIGFTAAKRLGADPIIVAIIGGVLAYPSIVQLAKHDAPGYHVLHTLLGVNFNAELFGIPISLPLDNAYAYSIFPIIVGAWLASKIEPLLKKWIPAVVHSIFAPLIEIFVISTLLFTVFGPIIMFVSGGVAAGLNWVLAINYAFAGLVIGAFYQCLVIFGLHWAVIPVIAQQLAVHGQSSTINAIVSATMIAQGGGALAFWIKARSAKIRSLAGPATISAFCGVTEPAMYGLNLKYGRAFLTASVGGAAGGLVTGLLNINMYGFAGAFTGFASFVDPTGKDTSSAVNFWIASFVALAVAFVCTYFFGFKENDFGQGRTVEKVRLGNREAAKKE